MNVIFEGTIADFQKHLLTQSLPAEMQVRVVANVGLNGRDSSTNAGTEVPASQVPLTIDQIKELAEDDDDYFLRFYRASGH